MSCNIPSTPLIATVGDAPSGNAGESVVIVPVATVSSFSAYPRRIVTFRPTVNAAESLCLNRSRTSSQLLSVRSNADISSRSRVTLTSRMSFLVDGSTSRPSISTRNSGAYRSAGATRRG